MDSKRAKEAAEQTIQAVIARKRAEMAASGVLTAPKVEEGELQPAKVPPMTHKASLQKHREHSQRLLELGPLMAAEEKQFRCEYCDELLIPVERSIPIGSTPDAPVRRFLTWPTEHGCPLEKAALVAREAAAKEARVMAERDEFEKALHSAGLQGKLREATFENFKPRQEWGESKAIKGAVQAWSAASLADGENKARNWLVLTGNYGTGKSHLAAAVIHEALAIGWRQCYFRSWTEYLKRLQATWDGKSEETEAEITAELQRGQLVVIDDLDKRRPTGWSREVLYTVLNYRYTNNLRTIITLNVGPGDVDPKAPGRLVLETYLGRATMDRLLEEATIIEFGGPSYRSQVVLTAGETG